MRINKKISGIIFALVFLTLIAFPLFMHLEHLPFRLWDESRIVNNSIEMLVNENYIVTHYNGEPEMWSTKPPLLVWLQVISLKIFGLRELSFRLPSVLMALLTVFLLFKFSIYYLKDRIFGIISSFVLITSVGYMSDHGVRTADFDSLLAFNTTAFSVFFFLFLNSNKKKFINLFFVFLTLAVLTKNSEGIMFLPGLFLFSIYTKKLKLLLNRQVLKGGLLSIAVIAGFFFTREQLNPGYIQHVLDHDFGLLFKTVENKSYNFTYFFELLIWERYSFWFYLLLSGFVCGLFSLDIRLREISMFFGTLVFSYLVIISLSETKVAWYDIPLYPLMAVLVSTQLYIVFKIINSSNSINKHFIYPMLSYIFLIAVFIYPYSNIINLTYKPSENFYHRRLYGLSNFLRERLKSGELLNEIKICNEEPRQHLWPYVKMMNLKGSNIRFQEVSDIQLGDMIILSDTTIKRYIEQKFQFELNEKSEFVNQYHIIDFR